MPHARRLDHIDLRVPELAAARQFNEKLLPALGFKRRQEIEDWLQFEGGDGGVTEFFGVTESKGHVPNENRIAFWAESDDAVDELAEIICDVGGCAIEGPMLCSEGYYAIFFEDPCGNRFEVCHRLPR